MSSEVHEDHNKSSTSSGPLQHQAKRNQNKELLHKKLTQSLNDSALSKRVTLWARNEISMKFTIARPMSPFARSRLIAL